MTKNRRAVYLSSCLAAWVFGTVFLLFQKEKPGFSINKIRSAFEVSSKWFIAPSSLGEKEELKKIFDQDYNYLGSGAQMFAFLSADGKYVLKFFKIKHLQPKRWLKFLPIPGLSQYRFNKVDKRILRHQALFSSYKMAYEELKDETGLVYIHLNKSKDLETKLRLFDRMRNCFLINIDRFEFVVQKKAQPFRDRILLHMQEGDQEGAALAIRSLFQQIVHQCKKGFIDGDSGISNNYGFVGNEVIHFDVGRIVRDEEAKNPSHYQREILRVSKKLENWLSISYPWLIPILEEEVGYLIDPSS